MVPAVLMEQWSKEWTVQQAKVFKLKAPAIELSRVHECLEGAVASAIQYDAYIERATGHLAIASYLADAISPRAFIIDNAIGMAEQMLRHPITKEMATRFRDILHAIDAENFTREELISYLQSFINTIHEPQAAEGFMKLAMNASSRLTKEAATDYEKILDLTKEILYQAMQP